MIKTSLGSWGRLPIEPEKEVLSLSGRHAPLPQHAETVIPYGNGRSYGDVGLNPNAALLHTRSLDHFIAFDEATGILRCESGVLLSEILRVFVPRGWFLPVTPGTRFVTVGGAIANDVHSKNHHGAGTFGCHVLQFELLRSDGSRRQCSPNENPDWFFASIGGLGLTGLIVWAEIMLKKIPSAYINVKNQRFDGIEAFFEINAEAEAAHEYTVAWIDCLSARPRGIFMSGDHASHGALVTGKQKSRNIPLTPPFSLVGNSTVRGFNALYYRRPLPERETVHYEPFFYPLDGLLHWNRIYGPKGFYQYQCVIPIAAREALSTLLQAISKSGQGSFLAVLKTFGEKKSGGLLSFPIAGATLALDFQNKGPVTLALFDELDAIVVSAGGRLYPAKDARMRRPIFEKSYPEVPRFLPFIDPLFSSAFARRVGLCTVPQNMDV